MNLGRRGLLKALGVSAAAAPMVGAQLSSGGLGVLGSAYALGESGPSVGIGSSNNALRFGDFASWLMGGGDKEARQNSRHLTSLDPDIAMMSVPLNTKVIWQRERNYKTIIAQKRDWFGKRLSQDGYVEDWF